MVLHKVTIGIPTFNEEKNILNLLRCLERDISKDYIIIEVIISDDSSDNTPELVCNYIKNSSLNIKLEHHDSRRGAAAAWNEIFDKSTGDIVVLYDADILLEDSCTQQLVSTIREGVGLCASNPKPVPVKGLVNNASIFISSWLRSIRKNRLSKYTAMGRALSIRSNLAEKISIPHDIIAIDLYLQCKVLEYGSYVVYNDDAVVYFSPAKSMSDFASQIIRAVGGYKQIHKYVRRFELNLPKKILILKTVQNMVDNPIGAISALICYVLIPFYKFRMQGVNSAIWHPAKTTKSIG
jgi:glycosyltransferase involved in cell wall biosynthesis